MVVKHAQDSGFAMPKDGGALTEETHTLMLLAIALATGSPCIDGLVNKALASNIERPKILETIRIARFAEATRVFQNAEHVLAQLDTDQ
jgi:alkylhydroperoxidase/carboxymuconolactone decarboxylase family protein YurZ